MSEEEKPNDNEVIKENEKLVEVNNTQEMKSILNEKQSINTITIWHQQGDPYQKFIALFASFKLHLITGKTIILCENRQMLYKVYLFLKRIGVSQLQLYNYQDPQNLRYYVLTTFNTGVVQVLITNDKIFTDLKTGLFFRRKRKILQLKNPDNIILFDFNRWKNRFRSIIDCFHNRSGLIITLLEQNEEELYKNIQTQYSSNNRLTFRLFPLTEQELQSFRYRIQDVVLSLSKATIDQYQAFDFRKKLLKAGELKSFFQEHKTERDILITELEKISRKLKKGEVTSTQEIPEYLIPDSIKIQWQLINNQQTQQYNDSRSKKDIKQRSGHRQRWRRQRKSDETM